MKPQTLGYHSQLLYPTILGLFLKVNKKKNPAGKFQVLTAYSTTTNLIKYHMGFAFLMRERKFSETHLIL